ncbi:MAG: endopeptidase La [Alphaproteobacteria bacterium]|nr:endopeptidase La [Alphaproteobacteria bacterium]
MFFRDKAESETPAQLPMLPMRDVVVFPDSPMSLIVGRPRSVSAVAAARKSPTREIFLAAQRSGDQVNPNAEDIYQVGTIAVVEEVLNLPNGSTKILVEGRRRARIVAVLQDDPHFVVEVEEPELASHADPDLQALVRTVKSTFERYVKLNRAVPPEMLLSVNALEDPDRLADMLVAPLQFKTAERQELLETFDTSARLDRIYKALLAEIEFLQVEKKLKSRVKRERESSQREFWLNEQMKAIQKELGDKEGRSDLEELASALAEKDLPDEVRDRAEKELRKLAQMNLMSAEATVVRNYLDWIVQIPWSEESEETPSLEEAARILDKDHFGLRRIKERILEYLAVASLVEKMRGPILCLVGPPGVGKTSLARSIARATNRPFVKLSLGGLRDEAEIRGHRRTYIGAMPGKLVHAMKRAGQVDPVILLDEIDKMSSDFRGDPSAALLEVLDPEQNTQFNDHYLDLDYDLSKAMFVCTANALQGIPLPLQDRLEIIELSGYTELEKAAIARRYLLPRQMELNGLEERNLTLSDPALLRMIRSYTRESGVRKLEQEVARICRKVARRVVHHGADTVVHVTTTNLDKLLGVPPFKIGERDLEDQVGTVKGLAVSPWGGELLNIEVAAVKGKGKLILTGRLGDWLKESANAALTYLRTRAEALHLDPDFYETQDLHIHYPGNALKTDGPSAGIAMATALVSALTQIPVRADTAMTGEISLRGRVLPIGGLKEKVLAAHRGGIVRVLIPEDNVKDIEEIPERVRKKVEIIAVSHMDRVLKEALAPDQAAEIFGSKQSFADALPTGSEEIRDRS